MNDKTREQGVAQVPQICQIGMQCSYSYVYCFVSLVDPQYLPRFWHCGMILVSPPRGAQTDGSTGCQHRTECSPMLNALIEQFSFCAFVMILEA